MDIVQKKLRDGLNPGQCYYNSYLQLICTHGTWFTVKYWMFNHTIRYYYKIKIWFKYKLDRKY